MGLPKRRQPLLEVRPASPQRLPWKQPCQVQRFPAWKRPLLPWKRPCQVQRLPWKQARKP
jgi:hypothetical protein